MPLSKQRDRERKRQLKERRRQASLLGVRSIMSPADVRAMRRAGLNPEDVGSEEGKVSSAVYYTLLRDRDALKAHLSWHHDQVGKPDIGTIIETLQARVTLLEAEFALHEAQEVYYQDKR